MSVDAPQTFRANIVFLILRRLRRPLILLVAVYAVSVLGLTLIPGVDPDGNPWRMSIFHAFYFVSFMGTTIGFGEIPYPFTDAQRLWTTFIIYGTVTSWLYAIGTLLTLIQDPAFRSAVTRNTFIRTVRRISDPFYLVCGYGDTGSLLVRALTDRWFGAVVIDIDRERINSLELEGLHVYVPGLCADAADPSSLIAAGLKHPRCVGVVGLTNEDHVNLKVAITTKLLNPKLRAICRADTHDSGANMASFGTDQVINPFDTFAERLAMAIHSPAMYLIHEWLSCVPHTRLAEPVFPPRGKWLLCGYGRFGKAVHEFLQREGVETTIIEATPETTGAPEGAVIGRGTEASTLHEAHIEDAVGIVAGTDDDANNLSIVITARKLNDKLFVVARQNRQENEAIFAAAELPLVMQRSVIIARKIQAVITQPLLVEFLRKARQKTDSWANILISRISGVTEDYAPELWTLSIDHDHSPGLAQVLGDGAQVQLQDLLRHRRYADETLPAVALLARQNGHDVLLPPSGRFLALGDTLLFCGAAGSAREMDWLCGHPKELLAYRDQAASEKIAPTD